MRPLTTTLLIVLPQLCASLLVAGELWSAVGAGALAVGLKWWEERQGGPERGEESAMRLSITNESGILIEQIEGIEEYDLANPIAAASLLDDIRQAMMCADAEPNRTRGDWQE